MNVSRDVLRELDAQVFWGGEKEHLLRGKISAKFKTTYTLNVALVVYRGETKELDEVLNRTEINQNVSRDIMLKISKEEEYKNIIFLLVNTELGNRRFEAYLDSLAQEAVARSLQMDEERIEGQKNAEKWIAQWIDEIIASGMADIVFRGDAIHVPFNQCSKYLKNNYVSTIFKYGLDVLPAANTAWNHQTSKSAVEWILYTQTKSELDEKKGADAVVKYLLTSGNTVLFDEKMQLISDDSNIPVVKLCQEVNAVFEKKKNETSINLADELKFLIKPEYGYYQNRLFMGALALALRPYVDRLYTSGNGQRIDKTVMKDIVVAIFNYWENNKYSDKFVVRMSTEEERALTDKLNMIFGITDQEGLLGTKWAIRTKFQSQSKAPLWALKYVGNCTDKYKEFIDKMFRFSKSTDDSIQQSFIIELLEGIKTFDLELSGAIASVNNIQCLDNFLVLELSNIGESVESLQSVKNYLEDKMPGDLVFWEEQEVREQILRWKIRTNIPAENAVTTGGGEATTSDTDNNQQQSIQTNVSDNDSVSEDVIKLKKRVKMKIESNKTNSEKMYQILVALIEKYSEILEDVDKVL